MWGGFAAGRAWLRARRRFKNVGWIRRARCRPRSKGHGWPPECGVDLGQAGPGYGLGAASRMWGGFGAHSAHVASPVAKGTCGRRNVEWIWGRQGLVTGSAPLQ